MNWGQRSDLLPALEEQSPLTWAEYPCEPENRNPDLFYE
jgi:hypothetical protein